VLHSYGAIQSLVRLLALLRDGGFILVNDYGQTEGATEAGFEHQRFSDTTAVAVNFHLLKSWLSFRDGVRWEQLEEKAGGHARLIGNAVGPDTVTRIRERFGKASLAGLEETTNAPHRAPIAPGITGGIHNDTRREVERFLLLHQESHQYHHSRSYDHQARLQQDCDLSIAQ
jgi:hypothetical protein